MVVLRQIKFSPKKFEGGGLIFKNEFKVGEKREIDFFTGKAIRAVSSQNCLSPSIRVTI